MAKRSGQPLGAGASRPDDIRRHNLSLVLSHVHQFGALTRAELTARLGLSRSTIGALVADLADQCIVAESVPSGGTRAGRPSHVVGPHPAGPFVIAVDVEVTHLTAAAIGLGGEQLARRVVPLAAHESGAPLAVAHRIRALVSALVGDAGLTGALVRIGVSVPGTVDRFDGVIGIAPNLGWRDARFGSLLEDLFSPSVPVVVGNDADLAVIAEQLRGAGRGCEDIVFLMGRTGVGAGIIVNGEPLRGHDGHAGEIGHTVVEEDGPDCHCGKRGCLETFVGVQALLGFAGRDLGEDPAVVFDAALGHDERAVRAVERVATSLGRAVAGLVNALNPERVLLGGVFTRVHQLAGERVHAALAAHVLDAPGETVLLGTPELGADSALIGAAELAFSSLLDDPLGGRLGRPLSVTP